MTRESREPTTTETAVTQLETAYEAARTMLESAYREGRARLEAALASLRAEYEARRKPGPGSRGAAGTEVPVERGTAVGREREDDDAATPATDRPEASTDATDAPDDGGSAVDDAVEPAGAEASDEPVETLSGIGPAYAERLGEAGVETVGELAAADPAELAEASGLGEGRVSSWIEQASDR